MENSAKPRRLISKKFSLTDIFSYFRARSGKKEAESELSNNQISNSVKRFYTISTATFQKHLKSPINHSTSSKSDVQCAEDDENGNMNESWYSCSNFFDNAGSHCCPDRNFGQLEKLERHREALFTAELHKTRKFEFRRCQTEDTCTIPAYGSLATVKEESAPPFFSIRDSVNDLEQDLTNASPPNLSTHSDRKPPVPPKPNCSSSGKILSLSPKNYPAKFTDVQASICNLTRSTINYDNWKNFNCLDFEQDEFPPISSGGKIFDQKYATVRSMADLMIDTSTDRQKINFRRKKNNDGNMQQQIERKIHSRNDVNIWRSKFISIINENPNFTTKQKSDYILHMQDLEKVTALIVKLTVQLRQIEEKEDFDVRKMVGFTGQIHLV